MNDLISRQAAINKILGQPPEPHYPSWYAEQIKELPSAQLDTYWKEQCQSYEQTINKLRESLSTQPEIIRCKDCKHWDGVDTCDVIDAPVWDNDFCSYAGRREVTT
jgi:hypothetical protein